MPADHYSTWHRNRRCPRRPAALSWSLGQQRLLPFARAFTHLGYRRFGAWITALSRDVAEPTITPSVLALERTADRRARERCAADGAWDADAVTTVLTRLIEDAPGRIGHGYHVSAVDDTTVHRDSKHVRGTCTVPDYTARGPNRAATVRAHDGVVLGALLRNDGSPARSLPSAGRPSFRKSRLPKRPEVARRTEPSRTQCESAVESFREQARVLGGRHLGIGDGGDAPGTVVRPLVVPEPGPPRLESLTRSRRDARRYALPPKPPRPNPKGGRRLPPPRQGGRWSGAWPEGHASIDGRMRAVRWKEVVCLWRVAGHDAPVTAVVAQGEGDRERLTPVTSAEELTGSERVELFAARSRQEDGFRDLKQRLGWEECRAWTKGPIVRTGQAQWVTMSLVRLVQFHLEERGQEEWWSRPPWDRKKGRPSVLDVERSLRRYRREIQHHLSAWLGDEGEVA